MYNSSKHKRNVLGYVYLFLAVLGIFYYVLSFTATIQKPTAEQLLQRRHCGTMLLLCIIVEVLLGVYIKMATQKMMLFFQSLATMLMFTAHCFYVYSYFTITEAIAFSSQNASDAALIILVLSTLLHAVNLIPQKKSTTPIVRKPIYDPFDNDEDY